MEPSACGRLREECHVKQVSLIPNNHPALPVSVWSDLSGEAFLSVDMHDRSADPVLLSDIPVVRAE